MRGRAPPRHTGFTGGSVEFVCDEHLGLLKPTATGDHASPAAIRECREEGEERMTSDLPASRHAPERLRCPDFRYEAAGGRDTGPVRGVLDPACQLGRPVLCPDEVLV